MNHVNQRLNIAVVGTGIAGMSAAWLLNQRHRITVYEKNPRVGGHSNTIEVPTPSKPLAVDTGFIVYNTLNYPNLEALFRHLDVPTRASTMSFAASLRGGALEYSGSDLNGLLGQRRNLLRPSFWRMLKDTWRFYETAPDFLLDPAGDDLSLGDYLARERYGQDFIRDHLLPMGAAIWSTTPPEMLAYPAKAFIGFFKSHGLLTLRNRPEWRTVEGGSRAYVSRLTAPYADRIRHDGVRSVRRGPAGVMIEDMAGRVERYDHVVIASHADEALGMLSDADQFERDLLGKWRYTRNRAVLHSDARLMPRRRRVWSSWNFIGSPDPIREGELCVTYWMNELQGLVNAPEMFVTLNPVSEPAADLVHYETQYTHPLFDAPALWSQRRLWSLQGRRNTWFCGSYFGHGFHEDGLQSGLAVAEQLGGLRRPWTVPEQNGRIHLGPSLVWDSAA